MTLMTALRRIFRRPEAVDVAPGAETETITTEAGMVELTRRLAEKRGDNVTTNSGGGHDTTLADIAEFYDILKPRITPEFVDA